MDCIFKDAWYIQPSHFPEKLYWFPIPSSILWGLFLELASSGNISLKWMVLVGGLWGLVLDHWEIIRNCSEKSFCNLPLLNSLLSVLLRQLPFSFFPWYCVRRIITAESDQAHCQNTQLASSLCSVVRIITMLELARPSSKTSIPGHFADMEAKTSLHHGTCPTVQAVGRAWPTPRSPPLSPACSSMTVCTAQPAHCWHRCCKWRGSVFWLHVHGEATGFRLCPHGSTKLLGNRGGE